MRVIILQDFRKIDTHVTGKTKELNIYTNICDKFKKSTANCRKLLKIQNEVILEKFSEKCFLFIN